MLAEKWLQTGFVGFYGRILLRKATNMPEAERAKLKARCVALGKERRGVKSHVAAPPSFWVPVPANFKNLGRFRPAQKEIVYGSEPFEWVMCNFSKLTARSGDAILWFSKFLRECCPKYMDLFDARFGPAVLVQSNGYNLDLAFLEGVWRYTHAVGKDWFPQGLYAWPPPDDWRTDARCLEKQSTWRGGVPRAIGDAAAAFVPASCVDGAAACPEPPASVV